MSKILIVEDEESIADLEKDYLELSGFEVEIENQGDTGLVRAVKEDFDLLILDLMLPEVDGFEICREVREKKDIPIIMVSAKKDDIDKIRGLGLGADDYMTKPFAIQELLARVRNALRKQRSGENGEGPEGEKLQVKDLIMYPSRYEVTVQGEEVQLTKKEYSLLEYLLRNKRNVLTRDQILQEVWGYDYTGDTNVVDVYIRYLRAKIDDHFNVKYIYTVRGVGYAIKE